jgi:hypothetical protein
MSELSGKIVHVREGAEADAAKLPEGDALRHELERLPVMPTICASRSSRPRKAARSPAKSACGSTWTSSMARSCRWRDKPTPYQVARINALDGASPRSGRFFFGAYRKAAPRPETKGPCKPRADQAL